MTQNQINKLAKEIIKMAEEDQDARKGKRLNWNKMKLVDNKNRVRIKRIIKKYGYISPAVYGKEASKSAWLLVQHFGRRNIASMENYLSLIKKNPEGFDVKSLALLEDRILVYKNKPQIYGSQAYCPAGSDVWYFSEIADIKNVDKRRKGIGLQTLKKYAKIMEGTHGFKLVLPGGYIS